MLLRRVPAIISPVRSHGEGRRLLVGCSGDYAPDFSILERDCGRRPAGHVVRWAAGERCGRSGLLGDPSSQLHCGLSHPDSRIVLSCGSIERGCHVGIPKERVEQLPCDAPCRAETMVEHGVKANFQSRDGSGEADKIW